MRKRNRTDNARSSSRRSRCSQSSRKSGLGLQGPALGGAPTRNSPRQRHGTPYQPRFELLEQRELLFASVSNLHLINDTGSSNADKVTWDARVTGTVNGDFTGGHVDIQFDHNNDGTYEGISTVTQAGATITYDARAVQPSLNTYAGAFTLKHRAVQYNAANTVVYTGAWNSFSMTLEIPPAPEIKLVDSASLEIFDGSSTVSFGSTLVGTPVSKSFTVQNTGTASLSLTSPTLPSGYSLVGSFPSSVAIGASAAFTVQFDATNAGTTSGEISFANNDSDENPFNFTLTAQASVPVPEIRVLDADGQDVLDGSTSIGFGTTQVGSPVTKVFSIQNTGTATLTIGQGSFSFPTGFSLVTAPATSLAPGAATSFSIKLNATAPGSFSGNVSFIDNDSDENPFDFSVSGTVIAPEVRLLDPDNHDLFDESSSYSFGTATVGTPIVKTFQIQNTGSATLTLQSLNLPSGFSVVTAYATSIAAGASSNFTVQLDAATGGSFSGDASFANNDGDENPFSFTISGTVNAPEIKILDPQGVDLVDGASTISFGSTPLGTAVTRTLSIQNVGTSTLNIGAWTLPAGYELASASASTLAPNASSNVTLRFTAAALGSVSLPASLANSDGDENPFDFTFTATATLPTFSVDGLHLLHDTGNSASDKITSDPTVTATVNWDKRALLKTPQLGGARAAWAKIIMLSVMAMRNISRQRLQ